jgi:hypothetical protein
VPEELRAEFAQAALQDVPAVEPELQAEFARAAS